MTRAIRGPDFSTGTVHAFGGDVVTRHDERRSRTGLGWAPRAGASTTVFPATAATVAALPLADTSFRRASRKPSTLFSPSASASSASSCTWLSWAPRAGASTTVSPATAAAVAALPLADANFRRASWASTILGLLPWSQSARSQSARSQSAWSQSALAHAALASPASSAHTANTGSSLRRRRRIHLHRGDDLLLDGHVAHRNRRRGAWLHALLVGQPHADRPDRPERLGSRHRFWQWTTRQHHRGIQFRWIQRDVT